MNVHAHPTVQRGPVLPGAGLRLVPPIARRRELHLVTYVVGNALAWLLWASIAVSAEAWYWWLLVPLAGWTLVLGLDLRHARHGPA